MAMTFTNAAPQAPAFVPFSINIDNADDAAALKLLMADTAVNAALTRTRRSPLNVTATKVRQVADNVYQGLKSRGVSYLNKQ